VRAPVRIAVVTVAAAVWAACSPATRVAPGEVSPEDAVVAIRCEVGDAMVWVDGRPLRQVRDLAGGIALAPGRHLLEVRHDAYHTSYHAIVVRARDRLQLRVDLAPLLD